MKKIFKYIALGAAAILAFAGVVKAATILPVFGGGTGWGFPGGIQAHSVLIGNGVNPLATTSPGTAGWVLTSNGASADPTFQAISATGIGDPFTHPAAGQSATTSLMVFNGNASTTILSATTGLFNSVQATSSTGLATSTFKAMTVIPDGNTSASVTVGGPFRLDNTLNAGAGSVFWTNHGSGATGRLSVFNCSGVGFDQDCVVMQGLAQGTNNTVLNVQASSTGKGGIKAEEKGMFNPNASAISADVQGNQAAVLFLNTTGRSTGNLITGHNPTGGVNVFEFQSFDGGGKFGVASDTPWSTVSIGNTNTETFGISTTTNGCAQFTNGRLWITGSGCGSSSGLTSYDAWTHPAAGISATTSQVTVTGLLSTASSTISSNLFLSNLGQGAAYIGSSGIVKSQATSTVSFNNGLTGTGFDVLGSGAGAVGLNTTNLLSSTGFTYWNGSNLVSTSSVVTSGVSSGGTHTALITITPTETYGSSNLFQDEGALNIVNTNNTAIGLQVSTNNASQVAPLVLFYQQQSGTTQPTMLIKNNSTQSAATTLQLEQSGNVALGFRDDSQDTTTGGGKFQINDRNGVLRFEGRNYANNSFEVLGMFNRPAAGGQVLFGGAGDIFSLPSGSNPLGMMNVVMGTSTTLDYLQLTSTTTSSSNFGNIFKVTNGGNVGIASTTPGSLLSVGGNAVGINFGLATSTFSTTGGINITSGCFAVRGSCVGGTGGGSGTVTNVATDATLTGGPITTTGTLGINLANANTWSVLQTFNYSSSTIYSSFVTASTTNLILGNSSFNSLLGTGLSNSGGVLTVAAVPNSALSNSTISGTALGGTLPSHSTNSSLTGTAYNGTAAVSNWGINLGNANTWTVNQTFNYSSSTIYSSFATASTTNLIINGQSFNNLLGAGLSNSGGALTIGTGAITNAMLAGSIDLTSKVTGTLPIGNGGTGASTFAPNSIITSNSAGTALIATTSQLTVGSILSTTTAKSSFVGAVGVGSSTPWALLSVANASPDYSTPLFSIATSSDAFGNLFVVNATSTTLILGTNSINTNQPDLGVRVGVGTINYLRFGGLLDQFTVKGRFNTEGWSNAFCDIPSGQGNNSTLSGFCGSFAIGLSTVTTNGNLNVNSSTGGYAYDTANIPIGTAANSGAAIFMGATSGGLGWLVPATSTPVMEISARLATPVATSSNYYIGFDSKAKTGTFSTTYPASGCFFNASSTAANGNWWAVSANASAYTFVDTGIASSTNITGVGGFRRFRIEADNSHCAFYIQASQTASLSKVANITSNVPATVGLNANVTITNGATANGAQIGLDWFRFRVWWRDFLPAL